MKSVQFVYNRSEKTRLDVELVSRIPSITRSQVSTLLASIKVNGKDAKLSHKLKKGEAVLFEYREPAIPTNKPENIPLKIVYEDENVIVINKQSSLTCHPCNTTPSGTLVNALNYYRLYVSNIKDEFSISLNNDCLSRKDEILLRQGIVHRLDKDTTGLIITARNEDASNWLKDEFKAHRVKKIYLALLDGVPKKKCGIIKTSIYRSNKDGRKFAVSSNLKKGRIAITRFRVIKIVNNISFVKFRIYTGRTHQIRVHAKYLGTPVLQDSLYGTGLKKRKIKKECGTKSETSLFLHAYKLELDIAKGIHKVFKAPIPKRFRDYIINEK